MQYERMTREEIPECAALAERAFLDYQYFSDYVPEEKKRARFLLSMLKVELKLNFDLMDIFTAKEDGRIAALAMLCPPDYVKPGAMQYLRAGFGGTYLAGGFRGVNDWCELEKKASAPCHRVKDAWYLSLLTVDTDCHGRGIGSRMLNECIIPYIREKGGRELTLFTNSEGNRVFYRKCGFEEFDERFFEYHGKRLGSWSCRKKL